MARIKFLSVALSCAVLLGACGGGGGGDDTALTGGDAPADTPSPTAEVAAAPTAEKLSGTWEACEKSSASLSTKRVYVLERLSDSELSYEYRQEHYPNWDCSGDSSSHAKQTGVGEIKGPKKTSEGANAIKLDVRVKGISGRGMGISSAGITAGGLPVDDATKLILALEEDGLRVGKQGKSDGEGYPDQLRPGRLQKKK